MYTKPTTNITLIATCNPARLHVRQSRILPNVFSIFQDDVEITRYEDITTTRRVLLAIEANDEVVEEVSQDSLAWGKVKEQIGEKDIVDRGGNWNYCDFDTYITEQEGREIVKEVFGSGFAKLQNGYLRVGTRNTLSREATEILNFRLKGKYGFGSLAFEK